MKLRFTLLALLLIFYGFAQNKPIKTKVFENQDYYFKYPRSWKIHENHGNLAVSPKYYLRNGRNYFNNILTIYKLDAEKYQGQSMEDVIEMIKDVQPIRYGNTSFQLKTSKNKNGAVYIIYLNNDSPKMPLRSILYIYDHKGIKYIIDYDAETSKYLDYIEEAMVIFDSFRFLN